MLFLFLLFAEIEAKEACDWLQAAGFPQYVQLFKDCRFPVDIEWAKRDHDFLDRDALDSLCRRLSTLNKCVEMRLEPRRSKRRIVVHAYMSLLCVSARILPNWTYDRRTRRWRRLDSTVDVLRLSDSPTGPRDLSLCEVADRHDVCSIHSSSSTESEGHNGHRKSPGDDAESTTATVPSNPDNQEASTSSSRCSSTNKTPSLEASFSGPPSPGGSGGGSSTVSLEAEGCFPDKPPRKKGTSLLRKMEKLRLRGTSGLLASAHGGSRPQHVGNGPVQCWVKYGPIHRWVVLTQRGWVMALTQHVGLQGRPNSRESSLPSSPRTISSSSSNSQSESSSTVSTPSPVARVRANCKRSNSGVGVVGATTRNNQNHTGTQDYRNQINNNNNSSSSSCSSVGLVFQIPHGHKPGTFPTSLAHKHALLSPIIDNTSVNWRTGSFHGYRGKQDHCPRGTSSLATGDQDPSSSSSPCDVAVPGPLQVLDHRMSVYDNVPDDLQLVLERIGDLQQLVSTWSENLSEDDSQRGSSSSLPSSPFSQDSPGNSSSAASPCPSSPSDIHLDVQHPEETEEEEEEEVQSNKEITVNEEEPKTRSPQPRKRVSQQLQWSSEQSLPSLLTSPGVESQSVSQFLLLQKHSLLKLTALMDKYSPSSKQGWNWTVPKSPRKTKVMEVKGRRVFGVPLLLSVQQTGEPLPPSILRALVYLRDECLEQVGLFRKSGVKSRIQYLRELVESDPDGVSFDGQSAFDVADMDQQLVAAQAAILLLPDENRMALRTLLFFLRDVVACVVENQMTPTNIAVCLAPSLSSHRKYSLGRPDQRDLSENLAATQGLANMITEAQRLFQLPNFWPGQRSGEEGGGPVSPGQRSGEEGGGPVSPGQSGAQEEQGERRSKLQRSTQHLLAEAREKSRCWESHAAPEHVELAFKKMADGCPLWMWRGSVEVDAPQEELLGRLLRDQELWEGSLSHAAVIQTLSKDTEVYRYHLQGHGLGFRPPQEHLLLRTWQADPSAGPLYLSSVSTEHPEVLSEGVRAHVYSCLYLLEPTGARKTRLTHLCRTDTRGRSQEWHNKVSGHLLASGLLAIRDSFRAEHKETKI
ncbi:hypothetical protein FQN60_000334 [Etheostoma spectabile]|uniref:Rho-GAP domain-containing protein n=1 Tax=Etheostoma spectabile TaxID=54343 RepID=A0A5J5CVM3_9PERO|nr:hypothetical protein FQN60_000334 [Etheostoma spectabile]